MFTIEQIQTAHAKVKSGADYPNYVQEIKLLGVASYETFVNDGSTIYLSNNGTIVSSGPKFETFSIAPASNSEKFISSLKAHQQGKSTYLEFRKECAEHGVEKWIADLNAMTCTYFDKAAHVLLVETIPS